MYSRHFRVLIFGVCCFLNAQLWAADIIWSNGVSANFTNQGNWWGNTVPTYGDSIFFTNKVNVTISFDVNITNANAYFNVPSGGSGNADTFAIGSSTWILTNSMIVGQNFGATSWVNLSSGTIVITNSDNTGNLTIGYNGRGSFQMQGGTLVVDRFYATNTGAASDLDLFSGTLYLSGGIITNGSGRVIGETAGIMNVWLTNGLLLTSQGGGNINLGDAATATGKVVATGSSTVWSNLTGGLVVGSVSGGNTFTISNGATMVHFNNLTVGQGGGTNIILVTGSGTSYTNGGTVTLANGPGSGNQIIVSNGATMRTDGNVIINNNVGDFSNSVIVTGPGSALYVNDSTFRIGSDGSMGFLIVTNGGLVQMVNGRIGYSASSLSNFVHVSGNGSMLIANTMYVGTNASVGDGSGDLLIDNGGTLQIGSTLINGFSVGGIGGTISNRGGVFEFTTATPTITTNQIAGIILTNGTLSYKGVTTANINTNTVGRMTFQGNNTFMLNNSTSILFSAYTFAPGNGTNFQHLIMANGGTRWQATNTTFNSGGVFTLSNTTATIFGLVTNNEGSIKIVSTNGASSTATFERGMVITGTGDGSGAIQNRNATNTITGPVTLMGASTISSASGKLTVDGSITNGGNALTVGGAGNVTLAGPISGTGGLVINGGGTVTISNSSANTFSGATTITNSTVRLSKAGALDATSGITLSASGTLLLDGGAIDRIGNTVGVTMQGGAITGNNQAETMGTLTLTQNSTITLINDGNAGDLTFANGSYTAGTLTINGWWDSPTEWYGDRGTDDKIIFTNDPGSTFLANVTFTGFAPGAKRLSTGEIIPSSLPEPGTVIASVLLSFMMFVRFAFKQRGD